MTPSSEPRSRGARDRTATRRTPKDLRRCFPLLKMRTLDRACSRSSVRRIGFYGTATGHEASVTGVAYALRATDWVFRRCARWASRYCGARRSGHRLPVVGNSGDVLIGRRSVSLQAIAKC